MLTRESMIQHAKDWIEAWNRRDVDHILSAFAPDARFRSPYARQFAGTTVLEGCEAMGAYWRAALERVSQLRFQLLDVICDETNQTMMVHYEAVLNGSPRRACEIFRFRDGMKVEAEALYGDAPSL